MMLPSTALRLTRLISFNATKCATLYTVRHKSSLPPKDLVLVDVNDKTGIATMTMNSLPVNSLNLELLSAMSSNLDILSKNNTRGMILTSSGKNVFSAGIDINEMYNPEYNRVKDFWTSLQDVWIKLYGSSFPTAAAIAGHAPAGGCFLAMSCEYRVMMPKFTIGLNETQLGIAAPPFFVDTMRNCILSRHAEMALLLGKLYKTDEALRIGLVDELATDKADAMAKCEKFLLNSQLASPQARALTKMSLRGPAIQKLIDTREFDFNRFHKVITEKKAQRNLGLFVAILKVRRVLKALTKPFGPIMKMFGGKKKSKKSK